MRKPIIEKLNDSIKRLEIEAKNRLRLGEIIENALIQQRNGLNFISNVDLLENENKTYHLERV